MNRLKMKFSCSQSWGEMTQVDKGRHCKHCDRTVIDFTQMSSQEIALKMEKSKGNLCGRFSPRQLNNVYFTSRRQKITLPTTKLTAGLVIASTLATQISCDEKYSSRDEAHQVDRENQTTNSDIKQKELEGSKKNISFNTQILNGFVLSKGYDFPIDSAKVSLITLDKIYSTYTDEKGEFQLPIPKEIIKKKNVVYLSLSRAKKIIPSDYKNSFTVLIDGSYFLYKEQIGQDLVIHADEGGLVMGWPNYYPEVNEPFILKNGEEISVEAYDKIHNMGGYTCGSVPLDGEYTLNPKQAKFLLGEEKGKNGLILMDVNEQIF